MYGISKHTRVANPQPQAVFRKAKARHAAQQHARATTHARATIPSMGTDVEMGTTATSTLALGYDFPSSRNVPDGGVHHAAARSAHRATETPLQAKNFVYSLLGESFPSSRMDSLDPGVDRQLSSSSSSSSTYTPRPARGKAGQLPIQRRAEVAREHEAAASLAAGIAMTTLGKEQAIAAIRAALIWNETISGNDNAAAHPVSATDFVKSGFEQMRVVQLPSVMGPRGESEGAERALTAKATATAVAVPPKLSTVDYNRYTSTVEEIARKYLQMPLPTSPQSAWEHPAWEHRPARISGRRGLSTQRTSNTLELSSLSPGPNGRGAEKRHAWQPAQVASYGRVVELPANSSVQIPVAKSTGLPDRRFRKASVGGTPSSSTLP